MRLFYVILLAGATFDNTSEARICYASNVPNVEDGFYECESGTTECYTVGINGTVLR